METLKKTFFFESGDELFNPFQPSVTFHIETSHLICSATGNSFPEAGSCMNMKCNTWLKSFKYRTFRFRCFVKPFITSDTIKVKIA